MLNSPCAPPTPGLCLLFPRFFRFLWHPCLPARPPLRLLKLPGCGCWGISLVAGGALYPRPFVEREAVARACAGPGKTRVPGERGWRRGGGESREGGKERREETGKRREEGGRDRWGRQQKGRVGEVGQEEEARVAASPSSLEAESAAEP